MLTHEEARSAVLTLNRLGAELELPVAREHYLTAALQLGYEALDRGWTADLTKEKFTTVLLRSAEYGALNKLSILENPWKRQDFSLCVCFEFLLNSQMKT